MFLSDIRSELEDNDLLVELFGKMTFEKDAENDIIVRMKAQGIVITTIQNTTQATALVTP
jgi:hypothetical protein